ncbi:MAG: hypothetical protein ABI481_12655 [Pyrinomonadaceae bacterium]
MRSNLCKTFRAISVLLMMGFCALAVFPQENKSGVQFFNGLDGKGMMQELPVGVFNVNGKQLGSDASVILSKDYFVRFCTEKDGGGKCEEFGEGTHNLSSTDFASIKVWKGAESPLASPGAQVAKPAASSAAVLPVVVYEQKNWGGRSQVFRSGMYRSFRGEFGKINDNQAMSVIVAKGFRARLCSDEGLSFRGSGDCEIREEGKHNLRFANTISFIEVIDLSDISPADEKMPVILYEDPSETGKMQGFDVGNFSANEGQFRKLGNDQASSIMVKNGYHASVCDDVPLSGTEGVGCEEFGPGKKNLKNKKSASYLRVWKD